MRILLLALIVALSGCVAMRPEEIRKQPPEVTVGRASVDDVVRCVSTKAAGYVQVTTYPGSRSADIEVQTEQMLSTRVLYIASVTPEGGGTRIESRFSGRSSLSLSEKDFRRLIDQCSNP